MTLRENVPDHLKLRIRAAFAKMGIEVSAYTGSFAEHRTKLILDGAVETVWDVGAHVGQYAAQLNAHGYRGQIVSIEPGPAAFARLRDRARQRSGWTALELAVAGSSGERTLHVSANGQSSSLLPIQRRHLEASPSSRYVASHRVATTTLDLLREQLRPPTPFFVKLDLQGGELDALRGASTVLDGTLACEVELSLTELYEGGSVWEEVVDRLGHDGFIICDFERVFFDPSTRDLLQINALFHRK
jgi:FkbM family methyltransferase